MFLRSNFIPSCKKLLSSTSQMVARKFCKDGSSGSSAAAAESTAEEKVDNKRYMYLFSHYFALFHFKPKL